MRRQRRRLTIKGKLLLITFIIMATIVFSFYYYNAKLLPIVEIMAISKVEDVATKIINEEVYQELEKEDINYENLVTLEKDSGGYITAIQTDMVKINKLKTQVALEVFNESEKFNEEVYLPMGNLFNIQYLSGRGPNIPIKVVPVGNVYVTFEQNFTSAGINQTRHQIIMEVTMSADVIIPGKNSFAEYKSQFIIAETIIVGKVPNEYFSLDAISQSVLDKTIYFSQRKDNEDAD